MTSDVVLTAALRSNLLSLQGTQSSIDVAQFRLSTGRKVNSALDNPQSFFAAQALNNRASDLTRLLDSIGQSIQVIKAADNGVTALTRLVEQADSIAGQARDALAQGQAEAKVVGNRDLRGVDDLTALSGGTSIPANSTLTLRITDDAGEALNLGAYNTAANSATATATITFAANDSIDDVIARINDLQIDDGNGVANGGQAFEASLNDKGHLQIKTLNGGNFSIDFDSNTAGDAADLALASELGFGEIARINPSGVANANNISFTAIAKAALTSFGLTYTDGNGVQQTALRSTTLNNVDLDDGTALFANLDAATDDYQISINGGTIQAIDLTNAANTAVTIQDFIDDINANSTLNQYIRADFNDETGQITISAISAEVKSIEIGVAASVATANFGFGTQDNDPGTNDLTGSAAAAERESIQLGAAASILARLEGEFNNVREQIDQLVTDTGYRGTNLLNGDNLRTDFNESRSSSLTTEGVTFTASGLGLDAANFSRESSVGSALEKVRSALESVRDFGSTLANDLSIIQTRQTFTTQLINTLKAGSDALTVADQNEEGAKLLALQTRQQLGVTALSLASQSQQSILRLF